MNFSYTVSFSVWSTCFLLQYNHPPASHAEGFAGPKASFCFFTWGRFLFTSLFISSLTNSHSPRRKEEKWAKGLLPREMTFRWRETTATGAEARDTDSASGLGQGEEVVSEV